MAKAKAKAKKKPPTAKKLIPPVNPPRVKREAPATPRPFPFWQ